MEQQRLLLPLLGLIDTPEFDIKFAEESIENLGSYNGKRKRRTWTRWISYVSIGASTLALGFACGALVVRGQNYHELRATELSTANATTCASAPTRREWRSLSAAESYNYIDAVICLKAKPSRLGLSNSLYDDFPYIHNQFDRDGELHGKHKPQNLTASRSTFCRIISALAPILHLYLPSRPSG
jgi:hypothetical protein